MAVVDNLEIQVQTNANQAATGIERLSQSMSKLNNATGTTSDGMKKANSAIKSASDSIKKVGTETQKAGKTADTAAKGGFSNFISSLKRIAFYRFIRSIIKGITDGLKEGISNLYQWSKAQKEAGAAQFAQSMDKAATAAQYLKNSIAAAASPLMNALAPAIDFIVDKLVSLINLFNQFFSYISGKTTWTRAIKQPTEYAKAAGGAAKAQQKWLAGFDELNNITTNEGGGGGGGTNFGNMFEEVPIDSKLISFFEDLGISDKLKELEQAFNKLKDSGFFELLENLVFDSSVYAFVNVLDLIIDNLNLLGDLKNGDWWAVLNDIKNIAVDVTFGWITPILALIDALAGTHMAPDFQNFIESLREFDLGAWAQQAVKDVQSFFAGLPGWFKKNIGDKILEVFGLTWKDVKDIYSNPAEWFEQHVFKPLREKFNEFIEPVRQAFQNAWAIVQAIWFIAKTWFENNVTKPIKEKFETLKKNIKEKFDGAWSSVKLVWIGVKTWFENNVSKPIKDKFESIKKSAKEKFDGAWSNVKKAFLPVATWFYSNVYVPINDKFIKIKSVIWTNMNAAWESVKKIFAPVGTFFNGIWNTISGIFRSIGTTIGNAVGGAFRSVVNSVLSWVEGTVNTVISKINTVLDFAKRFGYRGGTIRPVALPRMYDSNAMPYASGGFPEMGELFIAREAGPELVGRMGSKTTVANNEQIIEGVANGVYNAIVNTGLVGMVGSIDRKSGNGGAIFAPSVAAGRWVSRSLAMYQTAGGTV